MPPDPLGWHAGVLCTLTSISYLQTIWHTVVYKDLIKALVLHHSYTLIVKPPPLKKLFPLPLVYSTVYKDHLDVYRFFIERV